VVHFGSGDSDSELPPRVFFSTTAACRLLFISGENDYVEKWSSLGENMLYQIVLLNSLHLLLFPWKKKIGGITFRAAYVQKHNSMQHIIQSITFFLEF